MKINIETRALLKKHGFKWYKNQSTDSVDADCITDILPATHGFTVVYNDKAVFTMSTVKVSKIDIPDDLEKTWIYVHWDTIEDERKD